MITGTSIFIIGLALGSILVLCIVLNNARGNNGRRGYTNTRVERYRRGG